MAGSALVEEPVSEVEKFQLELELFELLFAARLRKGIGVKED